MQLNAGKPLLVVAKGSVHERFHFRDFLIEIGQPFLYYCWHVPPSAAALSISSLIVHTCSDSPEAIAGVLPFSASCLRPRLYHAMNRACMARVILTLGGLYSSVTSNASLLTEKIDSIHVRYNESRMLRFSIKTMVFLTAFVASFLGVLLSVFGSDPLWAILPFSMCAGVIIAWCVYREIKGDNQP
jgi:hypothetical protein